jgi:hypothetical protein
MNYLRTAILLAGLTALFMGAGYLMGGRNGAIIAVPRLRILTPFRLPTLAPAHRFNAE